MAELEPDVPFCEDRSKSITANDLLDAAPVLVVCPNAIRLTVGTTERVLFRDRVG